MSDNTGRDELKENNRKAIVDKVIDITLQEDVIKPDVSMFGESAGMADALLVVEGVRIPVIKVHSFMTVYSVYSVYYV